MENKTQEKESLTIFSKKLNRLLEQASLSQAEFARLLKVDKNSVNRWVTGKTQPKLNQLNLIINFFLTNDKTRNFNPLGLFFSESMLNDIKSSEYQKAILQIQQDYDSRLNQTISEYKVKLNKLQFKYDNRYDKIIELSKRKSYLESLHLAEQEIRNRQADINRREKNYKKQAREEIAKNHIFKAIYPESTAKRVLWNEDVYAIIKKMYELEKGNGAEKAFKDYFDNLVRQIVLALSEEMANIIKSIYNPEE